MPSAALTGRLGELRFSTASTATTAQTKLAELRDYVLTIEADMIDVTSHDSSGWKENVYGTRRWSWTAELAYLSTQAAQADVRDALLNNQQLNATFKQSTSNTTKKYQGKTRVTQFTAGHPTNDAVLGTMAGEGTLAITRTG